MAGSALLTIPSTQQLIAEKGSGKPSGVWKVKFDSSAAHEYITAWYSWYKSNPQNPEFFNPKSHEASLKTYLHIAAKTFPRFNQTVQDVIKLDPDGNKPVFTRLYAAEVNTLASLSVFDQKLLRHQTSYQPSDEVRCWLENQMCTSQRSATPKPFLFTAVANAYEHVFSFSLRMLEEYRSDFGALPSLDAFQDLSHQLYVKIGKEARLSRDANIILEDHYTQCMRFFSFTPSDKGIVLDIREPTPEDKAVIRLSLATSMSSSERKRQKYKAQQGGHYGCPAAFALHAGISCVQFVYDDVIGAVQSLWSKDSVQNEAARPGELHYRHTTSMQLGID